MKRVPYLQKDWVNMLKEGHMCFFEGSQHMQRRCTSERRDNVGKKAHIFEKGLLRGPTCHKVAYMQEEGHCLEKGLISEKRTNMF